MCVVGIYYIFKKNYIFKTTLIIRVRIMHGVGERQCKNPVVQCEISQIYFHGTRKSLHWTKKPTLTQSPEHPCIHALFADCQRWKITLPLFCPLHWVVIFRFSVQNGKVCIYMPAWSAVSCWVSCCGGWTAGLLRGVISIPIPFRSK